jgi:hypothetical protein
VIRPRLKTLQSFPDIREEAGLGLLTVVYDVDSALNLLPYGFGDAAPYARFIERRIVGSAGNFPLHQIEKFFGARQTPHMRRQNPAGWGTAIRAHAAEDTLSTARIKRVF